MKNIILIWLSILFTSSTLYAGTEDNIFNNDIALKNLTETKAYFDVTMGDPKKLLTRLQLIETTYKQLESAGISPVFIIGIRGKASNYFTKGTGYILDMDLPDKKQIETLATALKGRKITIEQCRIAAGFQEIAVTDFLSEIDMVANGYASLIGYQAKGYAFVPMD